MDKLDALAAFACLSQPMRLDAFRLLVKAGEAGMIAGDVSEALNARQNTMSANLSVLVQSGLVRNERQGRTIRFFADMNRIGDVLAFLLEDCCGGRPDLCQPLIDQISCGCHGPAMPDR